MGNPAGRFRMAKVYCSECKYINTTTGYVILCTHPSNYTLRKGNWYTRGSKRRPARHPKLINKKNNCWWHEIRTSGGGKKLL